MFVNENICPETSGKFRKLLETYGKFYKNVVIFFSFISVMAASLGALSGGSVKNFLMRGVKPPGDRCVFKVVHVEREVGAGGLLLGSSFRVALSDGITEFAKFSFVKT